MPLPWPANLSRLKDLAAAVAEACYPGSCFACRSFCEPSEALCPRCSAALRALASEPACPRCAKPIAEDGAPCPWCLGKGTYPYSRIIRLGEYEEPLRLLIIQMKYQRRWPLAERLADWLHRLPRTNEALSQVELVVPVPLHIRRHYQRGYNQAEVMARRLARRLGVKLVRPVRRIRNTRTQTELPSQSARHENVRGAFRLTRPKAIAGKHILVVDDVMTTGATLQAVGRALLPAKPASLSALILAVADPKRRDFQAI